MDIRQDLLDKYHAYLGITNHQAAAACLCILDVLDSGATQTHTLVTGAATRQEQPVKNQVVIEEVKPDVKAVEDSWARVEEAYRLWRNNE